MTWCEVIAIKGESYTEQTPLLPLLIRDIDYFVLMFLVGLFNKPMT